VPSAGVAVGQEELSSPSPHAPANGALPSLVRRLQGLAHAARQVRAAVLAVLAQVQAARRHVQTEPAPARNGGD